MRLDGSLLDRAERVFDFRFWAFWMGLCFTRFTAALLGGGAFFFGFLLAGSGKAMSSSISTSAFGSTGEVAAELGAVLGFV